MAHTHAQQFANQTLARSVIREPLAFTQRVAAGDAASALAAIWDHAGSELAPIARVSGSGLTASLERRGVFTLVLVTPPAPRQSGDPALIAIVGRGDGTTRMATVGYYVLELALDPAGGAPRFVIVAREGTDAGASVTMPGPLPDPRWFARHAFDLYAGRTPEDRLGRADLPAWYWWYALDGASAMTAFLEAHEEVARFEAVSRTPVLLLPEIADACETLVGPRQARRLRELHPWLRRSTSFAPVWRALIELLTRGTSASPLTYLHRALSLIAEAVHHGAMPGPDALELEALVRSKLAALGIDAEENYAIAERLFVEAQEASRVRFARGSIPPPLTTEDPMWAPLFLDPSELPRCAHEPHDDAIAATAPMFNRLGGLRAGAVVWWGDEASPMARAVDARWVFPTARAASEFVRGTEALLAGGLPAVSAPALGDSARAFGGELLLEGGLRRSQVIVIRVGRVVARFQAVEGAHAAASRQILHAAMLHPIASRIAQRARHGLAAYWLAVVAPTNAVPALLHSPGYDAARLLDRYPLLAHGELPGSLAAMGEPYAAVAHSLASFQAQVRAHRWSTYRAAMRSLVRALLDTDMGDARVNAAHALEVVTELRYIEPDPIWGQLDAECRARLASPAATAFGCGYAP